MFKAALRNNFLSRRGLAILAAFACLTPFTHADYVGSSSVASPNTSVQSAAMEILGNGGGTGSFIYKGGGNAVDAAVAAALSACVVNPGNCSLGGYGGHMMIWKSGMDGEPQLITCIDFNSAAGSLAASNMFAADVNPTNGLWTGAGRPANQYGWKAAGVPGTFAGLFMAQTNYGRKISGTNFFPFAEILKPALARIASGQATGNGYYTLSSISNLLIDLYTNSPGYLDASGQPNPNSLNDPYRVFYAGDIAQDIVNAMQANGGLVTYADMTNYRPREVTPYTRHFNCPNGTPARVFVAPPGSSGLSVLQELAIIEALGWTNGPGGTWNTLQYWHARAEVARLMWKDHFQWLGDPWSGVLPPDILGNGSTNFCEQLIAHVTNGFPNSCPSDPTEIKLTNSLAALVTQAVINQTNSPILIHWNDIRYGTCNISTSDSWGNCVAVTLSMGGGFGAQVAVTNRGLVLGQGMALFDPRPGWPNSVAPGKRQVNNMCPAIVVPDFPGSPTNGLGGGRPPIAVGGVGGSTIENNMTMQILKYLADPPSSRATPPENWLYNFEANNVVYMRPSYPAGVQSYFGSVGFSAPGGPPSVGEVSAVEAWIPPVIVTQPTSTNIASGGAASFSVAANGLPLVYQWLRNDIPLTNSATVSGAQTAQLTVSSVATGAAYSVIVSNVAASVTSVAAALTVDGAPVIVAQPRSSTNFIGTPATFSVSAAGNAPLAYQWLKNGATLTDSDNTSGASTSALNLATVSMADIASYSVVVTNSVGRATSAPAMLTITTMNPSTGLLLYEPFDYPNIGGPVSSNSPANWTYGGTGVNDLSIVSNNLVWPGLAGSIGHSVTNGSEGLGVRRLLGTNLSSGKFYFSALFRINDLGFGAWSGQSSVLGALTATDNTSFRLQAVVRSNSPTGYVIGTQKSGTGATPTYDATERHAGETIFLVGKYDFMASPNVATLWINPSSATFGAATEPASDFVSATSGTDGFTIDRFNMRQNAATGNFSVPASIQWDELRFGLTWATVTPPAPPPQLTNVKRLNNGAVQFSYPDNGMSYTVFASTNLQSWIAIGTATQSSPGWFQFIDSTTTNLSQRFYQLRAP